MTSPTPDQLDEFVRKAVHEFSTLIADAVGARGMRAFRNGSSPDQIIKAMSDYSPSSIIQQNGVMRLYQADPRFRDRDNE